jgi:hypothetical protein
MAVDMDNEFFTGNAAWAHDHIRPRFAGKSITMIWAGKVPTYAGAFRYGMALCSGDKRGDGEFEGYAPLIQNSGFLAIKIGDNTLRQSTVKCTEVGNHAIIMVRIHYREHAHFRRRYLETKDDDEDIVAVTIRDPKVATVRAFVVGNEWTRTSTWGEDLMFAYAWDRHISDEEANAIFDEPYQIFSRR